MVKHGEPLLGSAGDEFDIDDDSSSSQGSIYGIQETLDRLVNKAFTNAYNDFQVPHFHEA